MNTAVKMSVVALLGVAAFAGHRAWKRMPPFEQGIHETTVAAETSGGGMDAPRIGNCPLFPADNVWNTPVDTLPKHPRSQDYIDSIGPMRKMHMDFGSSLQSGIPYTMVNEATRPVAVKFDNSDESDKGRYPVPADAPIEGGGSAEGDRHVLLVDQRRCLLYELYQVHAQPDGSWRAGSGARFDLTSNALRTENYTSADAAGLPILPGLVRYEEVMAGAINHAVRFTVPHTQGSYVWPARHKASKNMDPGVPPMGIRLRLRANFDVTKYSRNNQVILKALKRYGMILADNGSAIYVSGVADKRWNDDDLHRMAGVTADDFEALDESDLQLLPDSGRVDPLSVKR